MSAGMRPGARWLAAALAVAWLAGMAPDQAGAHRAAGDLCAPLLADQEAHDVMETSAKIPGLPGATVEAVKGRISCAWGGAGPNGGVAMNVWLEIVLPQSRFGGANVARIARQWCRVHPAKARCVGALTDAESSKEFLAALLSAHRQAGGRVTPIDAGRVPAYFAILPSRLLTGAVAVVGDIFIGVQCARTPSFRLEAACSTAGAQAVIGNYLAARKERCSDGPYCVVWMPRLGG